MYSRSSETAVSIRRRHSCCCFCLFPIEGPYSHRQSEACRQLAVQYVEKHFSETTAFYSRLTSIAQNIGNTVPQKCLLCSSWVNYSVAMICYCRFSLKFFWPKVLVLLICSVKSDFSIFHSAIFELHIEFFRVAANCELFS